MKGKIGAESTEMVGSTFWFTLPLEKRPETKKSFDLSEINLEDCKVLILSDGAMLGKNFEESLNELNLNYDEAVDKTEAVEMLKWAIDDKDPFHVMIAEVQEGDTNAEEIGIEIKSDDRLKDTQLILLTSIGKQGDAKRFEKAGYAAFLSKPVEQELLHDCIKAVLSRTDASADEPMPIITRYVIEETKKHSRLILVVEDQETNLLTAKALINKLGYKVEFARDGVEAVDKHQNNSYGLILMDCQMPRMDGLEATKRIRANEIEASIGRIPIVAMTGNAFKSDIEECYKVGMDDFISKPVEPDILSQKIKKYIGALQFSSESTQTVPKDEPKEIIEAATTDILEETTETVEIDPGEMPEEEESIEDFLDSLDEMEDTPVDDLDDLDDSNEFETQDYSDEPIEIETAQTDLVKNKEPSPQAGSDQLPVFDRQKLEERFGGDTEIVEVVLESFSMEAPELIETLKRAVDNQDTEEIRLNCHALKGNAANVNAELLREAALSLEQDAKAQDISLASSKFDVIKNEYEKFTKECAL